MFLARLVNSGAARLKEERQRLTASASPSSRSATSSSAASKSRPQGGDPLLTFIDDYNVLNSHLKSPDQAAIHHGISRTDIPQRLESMAAALVSEAIGSGHEAIDGMGMCMEYMQKKEVLATIVQAAIKNRPQGVVVEAVKFFQTLVANLDARFLSQQAVNKPLVRLIRNCVDDDDVDSAWGNDADGFEDDDDEGNIGGSSQRHRLKEPEATQLNEALVGLMAFIASKLYTAPELLHIFFHNRDKDPKLTTRRSSVTSIASASSDGTQRPASPAESTTSSTATVRATWATSRSSEDPASGPHTEKLAERPKASYDFPLFIYLLRFVHSEGQTGALARAGLSVIVKMAFETRTLDASSSSSSFSIRPPGRRVRFSQDADENASAALDLAEYVLGSDFVDVIGASLGAVYGLLPSKLAVITSQAPGEASGGDGGMSLGVDSAVNLEDELARLARLNIEVSSSPNVVERTQLFADIFDFLQHDVLATAARTASTSVSSDPAQDSKSKLANELVDRLAESVRLSLFNNILLSSMIESGDRDGSATAVMSYMEVLLCILDDASPLADTVVSWLVRNEDDDEGGAKEDTSHSSTGITKAPRRRKSTALTLLERGRQQSNDSRFFDPFLHYTVKNLILDHLSPTTSHGTVAAALGLANSFLARHGRFAPHGLIEVSREEAATCFPGGLGALYANAEEGEKPEEDEEEAFVYPGANKAPERRVLDPLSPTSPGLSLQQHLRELELYHSLISALEDTSTSTSSATSYAHSTGYEKYLEDAQNALLSDSAYRWGCSPRASGLTDPHSGGTRAPPVAPFTPYTHRLDPEDTVLRAILSRLRRFFEQPPEVNVSLTALISTICICPYRNLEGFLTFHVEQGDTNKVRPSPAGRSEQGSGGPILLLLLRSLVVHVQTYRSQVPDFDAALEERRRGLLYVENLSDALAGATDEAEGTLGEVMAAKGAGASSLGSAGPMSRKGMDRLWRGSTGLAWPGFEAVVRQGSAAWQTANGTGTSGRKSKGQDGPDAKVVDARELKLPPRPSDGGENESGDTATSTAPSQRQTDQAKGVKAATAASTSAAIPAAGSGLLSNSTMNRLFGRGARTPAHSDQHPGQVTSTSNKVEGRQPDGNVMASTPFADHYAKTAAVSLEPLFLEMPPSPWSGRKTTVNGNGKAGAEKKRTRFQIAGDEDDEDGSLDQSFDSSSSRDTYYPGIDDDETEEARRARPRVTLSHLLDNVVLLEEFLKMLAAVLQVRRSMGVDRVIL